jgi:hypothetical protein
MKYISFMVFTLVILFSSSAQYIEGDSVKTHTILQNKISAKIDVSNVVNPRDPSLLMSLEYQYKEGVSFTQEFGLVMDARGTEGSDDGLKGFKAREELRFYLKTTNFEDGIAYLSINGLLRFLNMGDQVILGYGCEDGDYWSCDFVKGPSTDVKTMRYGGAAKVGIIKPVTDRLTLEADVGLSLQYNNVVDDYHTDITLFFDNNSAYNEWVGWWMEPVFAARIGYVIGKK